ncbi:glycoprotease family-domain-containing protein [Xylariaceae sp. FL1272]|nr:glycoprotease family-domain-containing protein [Xylariaceae sp. FL1272]
MRPPWMALRRHGFRGSLSPPSPSCTARPFLPWVHMTRLVPRIASRQSRRPLLTLAIESSCDDTCVAVLDKAQSGSALLHFNDKITSDNRSFRGVHPLNAVVSHTNHLAPLIQKALRSLPLAPENDVSEAAANNPNRILVVDGCARIKPDFVSVTRGPGMASNLATGLNTAKGLAVAWDVPLLAVNHMQAHALTPRLVNALDLGRRKQDTIAPQVASSNNSDDHAPLPEFPFLSLLVSGGHTMLVRSQSLNDHAILATSLNIAVGDMIDKCARMVLPPHVLSGDASTSGMYGPLFEKFAFPEPNYNYVAPTRRADEIAVFDSGLGWTLTPPLALMGQGPEAASTYDFSGLNGHVQKLVAARPEMDVDERRLLAREVLRLTFEHLVSRVLFALRDSEKAGERVKTIVLSGGVASNKFLRHVVRAMLDARGFGDIQLVAPPVSLCTDNAAMIAWTGIEMYEQGWRSELDVLVSRKWPLDPRAEGGGILGLPGWYRVES